MACVIASPDTSEGLQHANGKLFPFGFLHILRAMRRSKQLDLFLGAVRPDLQGRGLTAALGVSLFDAARQRGFTHLDSHLVMERNTRMCAELERLGAVVWKRYCTSGIRWITAAVTQLRSATRSRGGSLDPSQNR
ncbi:MAG: hypothetical protein IPG92_13975 [Flavobacteriales bacterium]|nr:hypothetical protein [Flavobacteriales bacterium]